MARLTKAMLEDDVRVLRRMLDTRDVRIHILSEHIKTLEKCGDGRVIQTLCCAHDKAIDALSHALTGSTALLKEFKREGR